MDLLNIKCEFTDPSIIVVLIMVLTLMGSIYGVIFGFCFEKYKVVIVSIICFIIGTGTLLYINGNKDKYRQTITQYYVNNESLIPIYAKNACNYNYEDKILTIYEKGCQITERSVIKNDTNK